jgi:hypothetical protein
VLAPLLLSLLAVAITLGRAWRHRKEAEEDERISGEDWRADAWRRCLLPVMIIMFIAVPPAASFAFRAFECEDFTEGGAGTPSVRYLRYDYSIECGPAGSLTAEYRAILQWAAAAVMVYVVGVPLGQAALLFRARDSLRREQPVPFTRALEFLHKVCTRLPCTPAYPPTRLHACLPTAAHRAPGLRASYLLVGAARDRPQVLPRSRSRHLRPRHCDAARVGNPRHRHLPLPPLRSPTLPLLSSRPPRILRRRLPRYGQ